MRVVAIGGGTGLSTVLRGLKPHVMDPLPPAPLEPAITRLTAVVTVTDEGGSSGRLRRDFRVLPPGDIRNCLVALAGDETLLARLFQYRFSDGHGLKGHSLGNLFLTALTHLTRDFAMAVRLSSEVLAIRGEIFPSTLADVRLKARLANGRTVSGEGAITRTRAPIRRLEIKPARSKPLPETITALEDADLILMGPGSLYTSLLPNLLVRGIPAAIARSRALKVYISNLMTQPGETRGMSAADHLEAIRAHAGRRLFDVIVLNTRELSTALRRRYAAERAEPVKLDLERIAGMKVKPVLADLLVEDRHVARHDSSRLAELVLKLAADRLRARASCQPG
jgi:uncharacterized cofD-like protein